jgi:hypothetical protein
MVEDSEHIVNFEQGDTSTPEAQPIAFKVTEEKEEPTPTKRLPIDASKLGNEEMALIIKSFWQIPKQRKRKEYKPRSKRVCYRCGKSGHYIVKCPYESDNDRNNDKKGKKKMEKKYYHKKKGGETHMGKEWMRAPPTPPPTRMPPTSPSTRVSSSPTSATSVSWPRKGKRRYTLETPQIYYFR